MMGNIDIKFQSDLDNCASTLGSIFTINNRAIYWCDMKQNCITDSITWATYIITSNVAKEVIWPRKFTQKLKVIPST